MIRCPCNKCLVQATCNQHCKTFGKFAKWLYKVEDKLGDVFQWIDDNVIPDKELPCNVYDWVGNNLITPTTLFVLILITGVKVHKTERTLFDDRYDSWKNSQEVI